MQQLLTRKLVTAFAAAAAWALHAQITITSYDFFYEPGQYYTARIFTGTNFVDIGGLLGQRGGPQAWNFRNLPYDHTARFEYVDVSGTPFADRFPDARLAEHKVVEGTGDESWLFLTQQPGVGRIVYGYYEPGDLLSPLGVFETPLIDFRENITYGDSWSGTTRWLVDLTVPDTGDGFGEIGPLAAEGVRTIRPMQGEWGIPTRITYTVQSEVDAYGVITLPDRSFTDCLRVNELAQYDIEIDFDLSGNFQPVASYYVRTYYWLAKDRGIVAQITSSWSATPPPDNFSTASAIMIQVETNHPETSRQPFPVTDLQISPGKDQVLLSWSIPLNATRFRIEAATQLGPNADWTEVTVTTNNFIVIPVDRRMRFFRIVSLQ